MGSELEYIGRGHTMRVLPSREQQRIRQIVLAITGAVFLAGVLLRQQSARHAGLVRDARAGRVEAVRAALDRSGPLRLGLDPAEAMAAAVGAGKGAVVRYLLSRKVDPNAGLEEAARRGHAHILRLLLDSGATVRGERGGNLLQFAAQSGSKECVHLLLRRGADRDAQNRLDEAMTPLHYAARSGRPGVVKVLLEQKASPHARTTAGRDALMLAAAWNEPAACKHLLDAGASVNARDGKGLTALMQAAVVGNADTAAYLLARGASLNVRDRAGKTALDYAVETGDPKTLNLLRVALRRSAATALSARAARAARAPARTGVSVAAKTPVR